MQLLANQSARVERGPKRQIVVVRETDPRISFRFVREMSRASVERLPPSNAGRSQRGGAVNLAVYRLTDLGTLGGVASRACDINAVEQVVGSSDLASGVAHAFLYDGGKMKDLDPAGADASYAFRVNNSGRIVGPRQFQRPAAPLFSTAAAR